MAKILSIGGYGEEKNNGLLESIWDFFSSQDKFVKASFIVFFLILVISPFLISDYLRYKQYASGSEYITFVSSTDDTAISQTDTPDIRLRITPPKDWTLVQKSLLQKAYAQDVSPTDLPTPTTSEITPGTSPPSTPTSTETQPTATPSATDIPSDTPIATVAAVLSQIRIYNSDDAANKNGSQLLTIEKKDIISALSTPVPWKLNSLAQEELSGTRIVTVEFVDENNNTFQAVASIVVTLPLLPTALPTATPSATTIPTITPTLLPTHPITTPSTVIPTNVQTVTASPFPTQPVTSNEPPSAAGQLIVKFKDGQSPGELLDTIVERQQNNQSLTGKIQNVLSDAKTAVTLDQKPEEKFKELVDTNKTANITEDKKLISDTTAGAANNPLANIHILKTNQPVPASELQATYKSLPEVEYAVPNYVTYGGQEGEPPPDGPPPSPPPLPTGAVNPNDSSYPSQWDLAMIHAADGWSITTGSPNTIVAVLDTGVDYNHSDLPTERIIKGADFVTCESFDSNWNCTVPQTAGDNDPMDQYGHGTFIAGQIAARTNNNLGISGINWNTKVMAVRTLNSQNSGLWSWLSNGIFYAVSNGAKVINISTETQNLPCSQSGMQPIIDYAYDRGVTIVTIAGNFNKDASTSTPGSCNHVITVGATDRYGARAPYSNYGGNVVLWAPVGYGYGYPGCTLGNECITSSTWLNNGYNNWWGTSFAAPQVAGVASLMLGLNPSLTPDQIRNILVGTADSSLGLPMLNMNAALLAVQSIPTPTAAVTATPTPTNTPTPTPTFTPSPTPTPTPNLTNCSACTADIDRDGRVSTTDYSIAQSCVGRNINDPISSTNPTHCSIADINKDNVINGDDVLCISNIIGSANASDKTCLTNVPTATLTPTNTPTVTPAPQTSDPSTYKYAIAGCSGGPNADVYCYTWDNMSDPIPPSQTQEAPNHTFAWVVGKFNNRHDGLNCGYTEHPTAGQLTPTPTPIVYPPCDHSRIDEIYNSEASKITSLLSQKINKGGVWIVGNEANWFPYINSSDYAYQFKKYYNLIKGLDSKAQLVMSGLLYYGTTVNPEGYLSNFLNSSELGSIRPDIYNVHFYPFHPAGGPGINSTDFNYMMQRAQDFRNLVNTQDRGKPIWVTEFGVDLNYNPWNQAVTPTQVNQYMDTMIDYFMTTQNTSGDSFYQRWFWYVSNAGWDWDHYGVTSLTTADNTQLTEIGQHYREKVIAAGNLLPTPTPTPLPITGDVDGNRCVDIADFTRWEQLFLSGTAGGSADLNGDGKTDLLDFNIWFKAFQTGEHLCN